MMTDEKRAFYLIERRRKKINQGEIADHIGVTQANISRLEIGEVKVSDRIIAGYKDYIENY